MKRACEISFLGVCTAKARKLHRDFELLNKTLYICSMDYPETENSVFLLGGVLYRFPRALTLWPPETGEERGIFNTLSTIECFCWKHQYLRNRQVWERSKLFHDGYKGNRHEASCVVPAYYRWKVDEPTTPHHRITRAPGIIRSCRNRFQISFSR